MSPLFFSCSTIMRTFVTHKEIHPSMHKYMHTYNHVCQQSWWVIAKRFINLGSNGAKFSLPFLKTSGIMWVDLQKYYGVTRSPWQQSILGMCICFDLNWVINTHVLAAKRQIAIQKRAPCSLLTEYCGVLRLRLFWWLLPKAETGFMVRLCSRTMIIKTDL